MGLRLVRPENLDAVDDAAGDAPFDDPPSPSEDPNAPRVLVADDDSTARDALAEILRRSGYRVATAIDGRDAINRLKETKIDALLLDLQMPGHDGFETLSYVQEHRRDLPTVLLTGLPPQEIQLQMANSRTSNLPPLFEKPCDPDQLLGVLDLLLAGELPPTGA